MLLREDDVYISFEVGNDQCRMQMPANFMMADTFNPKALQGQQFTVSITMPNTTLDTLRRLIEGKDAIEAASSGDFEPEEKWQLST